MMPRFFKDMPPAQAGYWDAIVLRTYSFTHPREVRSLRIKGLRRAYIAARIMALWEDFITPYCDGEIGIDWAVRPFNKHGRAINNSKTTTT